MTCFEENISFEACGSSSEPDVSTNGLCGNGNGKCPPGECCSKDGKCGSTDDHCKISNGCQLSLGSCIDDTITTVTPITSETPISSSTATTDSSIPTSTSETSVTSETPVTSRTIDQVTTTTDSSIPTSTSDKCGEGIGSCSKGRCCSKYGWCGTSEKHCSVSQGCQTKFGVCTGTTEIIDNSLSISKDDRCGKEHGRCPAGKCCSKYGWCGSSDKYCEISRGCQSEFGECSGTQTSTKTTSKTETTKTSVKPYTSVPTISSDGKCGQGHGACPDDKCCSKYGYCGTTYEHCYISKGCQLGFGSCIDNTKTSTTSPQPTTPANQKISTNGKCGKEDGRCPNGYCCSQYGWCGNTSDYCGKGCQSEFGVCN